MPQEETKNGSNTVAAYPRYSAGEHKPDFYPKHTNKDKTPKYRQKDMCVPFSNHGTNNHTKDTNPKSHQESNIVRNTAAANEYHSIYRHRCRGYKHPHCINTGANGSKPWIAAR
jgi:hypothetical protein